MPDILFMKHHLISGLIPILAVLVLYNIVLHLFGKKQNAGHIVASFLFCIYLVGILTATGICIKGSFSPRLSFIPFAEMIRAPVGTMLNIILFVPLGFFLPLLYKKYDKLGKIALVGFLISLSVIGNKLEQHSPHCMHFP